MTRLASLALLAFLPTAVFAESATPSLGYTGAPTDHGGQNCSTCHTGNPLNDPSGSLQVTATDYVPSVQQSIRIVVQNPSASRWGFQITIREQSDQTLSSGSFALAEPNAYEFDVLWTPPSQEIGRLLLYVAAVAANGDGTPQGDHVYTYTQTLANAGGCDLDVQPVFQKVLNGASFQPGFSSGAMVSIFGSGFQTSGRQRTAGLGDYVNGAYPTELGCAAVQVTGPGLAQAVQLPISYVSPGQINAQMPEFSGTGPVTLTVLINPGVGSGISSPVATLNSLQPFAPAFLPEPRPPTPAI